ncbi:Cell wall-binding protein YocH [Peribacillus sp. Bi96]|uniref:3D domain-containing protein n=1 Tax=unclassified Peribacillus TaxID=2675266 RepID=UPI001D9B6769|nr:3D domain-containing protein [Peribacillus sp. Bi96]CAH0279931.1 Cell wall-binding protein YocH [Peribacillus sp. Bi96]
MKKILLPLFTAFFLVFSFSGVSSAATTTYKVKSGDTLWGIANKHNITVNQLKSWNNLKKDNIHPKQVLKVKQTSTSSKPKAKTTSAKKYKTITVNATAYTADCKGCSGITASGLNLKKNPKVKAISVDPKVIPLGTKVHVEGYGEAIAADKGGAIKGNKIDVFYSSKSKAINWGRKTVKVKVYK